jgi:Integrase core domain
VHAALAAVSRFVIDLRVGPRDLATAAALVASVAVCLPAGAAPPLILVDNHLPYPAALLQVFGEVLHRRRKRRRGRKKAPGLKPPPGLLVGVVHKVRDATGKVVKVKAAALFGRLKAVEARVAELGVGTTVNTAHVERLNGTLRCQQARLARRPRCVSRDGRRLQWSLWVWRDLYNWVRAHGALGGRTPSMAMGLSDRVWSVPEYVRFPVHVSDLDRTIGDERRAEVLTSALDRDKRRKTVPSS